MTYLGAVSASNAVSRPVAVPLRPTPAPKRCFVCQLGLPWRLQMHLHGLGSPCTRLGGLHCGRSTRRSARRSSYYPFFFFPALATTVFRFRLRSAFCWRPAAAAEAASRVLKPLWVGGEDIWIHTSEERQIGRQMGG